MGRVAALGEWLDGGNQRVVDAGCWRHDRGHRSGEAVARSKRRCWEPV